MCAPVTAELDVCLSVVKAPKPWAVRTVAMAVKAETFG
jgi:hypothetical protein